MSNTTVGFDGKSPPSLLPAIGSFTPMIPFTMTTSGGATTSETITFSQLKTIRGAMIFQLDGGLIVAGLVAVSWSGNVLTIADGSGDIDGGGDNSPIFYGLVWGDALA